MDVALFCTQVFCHHVKNLFNSSRTLAALTGSTGSRSFQQKRKINKISVDVMGELKRYLEDEPVETDFTNIGPPSGIR